MSCSISPARTCDHSSACATRKSALPKASFSPAPAPAEATNGIDRLGYVVATTRVASARGRRYRATNAYVTQSTQVASISPRATRSMLPGWLCVSAIAPKNAFPWGDVRDAPSRQVHSRIGMPAVVRKAAASEIFEPLERISSADDEDAAMGRAGAVLGCVNGSGQKRGLLPIDRPQRVPAHLREERVRVDLGWNRWPLESKVVGQVVQPETRQLDPQGVPEHAVLRSHLRRLYIGRLTSPNGTARPPIRTMVVPSFTWNPQRSRASIIPSIILCREAQTTRSSRATILCPQLDVLLQSTTMIAALESCACASEIGRRLASPARVAVAECAAVRGTPIALHRR
jgi:hypothetical protein